MGEIVLKMCYNFGSNLSLAGKDIIFILIIVREWYYAAQTSNDVIILL